MGEIMMEGWKKAKIGDYCKVLSSKRVFASDYVETGIPFYRSKEIIHKALGEFSGDEIFISEKRFNEFKNKFGAPIKGDILLSSVGNRSGIPYLVREEYDFYFKDGNLIWMKDFSDELSSQYLEYYLRSELGQKTIESMMIGAAQKALTIDGVKKIKINLPQLQTQRKIATILSAYDDLIEINLKRIKLLEEKAQLTYEKWFSIKGTPVGWNELRLGELIDYHIGGGWGEEFKEENFIDPAFVIRGTDMDNLPLGSIEKVPYRWHKVSNLKSRKLIHGDIVFEVSGGSSYEGVAKTLLITDGLLNQFNGDVTCASFCKLMRPISVQYSYALILFLKYLRKTKATEIFEKRSASNIVNYNWEAFLKFQKVKMPNDTLLKEFNDKVEPLITSMYNLGNQITKLKEARDILLPRLMTGMIDVENLNEIEVEIK